MDNVEELRILLYDGTQMTVGPTGDEELASIIAQGGRRDGPQAEIIRGRARRDDGDRPS